MDVKIYTRSYLTGPIRLYPLWVTGESFDFTSGPPIQLHELLCFTTSLHTAERKSSLWWRKPECSRNEGRCLTTSPVLLGINMILSLTTWNQFRTISPMIRTEPTALRYPTVSEKARLHRQNAWLSKDSPLKCAFPSSNSATGRKLGTGFVMPERDSELLQAWRGLLVDKVCFSFGILPAPYPNNSYSVLPPPQSWTLPIYDLGKEMAATQKHWEFFIVIF